jgi:hypothetical protein
LMQGDVIEHHPSDGRGAVGVDTSGTLHVDRVPWSASWRGFSGLTYPIAQLNEPPRANSTALFTPAWGAATPRVTGVAVVLRPFPPAVPFRDLVGTVTSVLSNSSVPVPSGGAVLVGRGTAASLLQSSALDGSDVTIRLNLGADWTGVTDAVSGGPTLVKNGQPVRNAGEALTQVQLNGRNPRTAIGQRADGGIVIVAADGRRSGWSVGITNWDLALTLIRYGCVTGFALDSGGSTTVALDGTVLNRPSDPTGERPVAESLVIGYTGVYAPVPAPAISPNKDGVADRETLAYKLVRSSTVDAKLIGPGGTTRELDTGSRTAGRYRFSWNGTDAGGAPAPEGRYHWNVTATDDLGRSSTIDRPFTLDKTLGFLHVSRGARRISFTLARDAKIRVAIETPYGDILRTVAAGPRHAGRITVRWNGRDGRRHRLRRGAYVVHVAATSAIGLSALQARLTVRA